jgi:hypothetical protein
MVNSRTRGATDVENVEMRDAEMDSAEWDSENWGLRYEHCWSAP